MKLEGKFEKVINTEVRLTAKEEKKLKERKRKERKRTAAIDSEKEVEIKIQLEEKIETEEEVKKVLLKGKDEVKVEDEIEDEPPTRGGDLINKTPEQGRLLKTVQAPHHQGLFLRGRESKEGTL